MVCLWKGCRSRHKALGKFSSLEKGCLGKVCSQWWGMNTGKIRCRQWKFVQQVVRNGSDVGLVLLRCFRFLWWDVGTASVERANSRQDFLRRRRNGTCCPGWDQLLARWHVAACTRVTAFITPVETQHLQEFTSHLPFPVVPKLGVWVWSVHSGLCAPLTAECDAYTKLGWWCEPITQFSIWIFDLDFT